MVDVNALMASFRVFVKRMPPNQEYDYADIHMCAFGQFLRSQGYRNCRVGGTTFCLNRYDYERTYYSMPVGLGDAIDGPATFGELDARLDDYFEKHPIVIQPLTPGTL